MMKKVILLLVVCSLLSCNEKKKVDNKIDVPIQQEAISKVADGKTIEDFLIDKKANSNAVLLGWISYHKEFLSKDFAIKNFIFDEEIKINRQKSNIYAIFDKEFDKIYEPFLIYSPQNKQYIDFDSYSWQLDDLEMKNVSFNPDQELSLVNIKAKKIERIIFNGPSQWIEDAFWIDENSLILLGNNSDFIPKIIIVNLIENKFKVYKYNTNLKESSGYSDERLRLKGLNVPGE